MNSSLRHRVLTGSAVGALALALVGCHHKTRTAYTPPPPVYGTQRPSRSGSAGENSRTPVRPEGGSGEASAGRAPQPVPQGKPVSSEVGMASWYGPPYANRKGADGTVYDQNAMTAAHRTLPMGTVVRVTNVASGQSVVVKITDRGPFVDGRILDLSLAAAKAIDVYRPGVAKVRVEAFAPPARPGVDPAGRWCVQIGAFMDPADAIQLKNDLARRYTTAKVIEFAGPTGHWVRINPAHPDKSTAAEIADRIHVPDPGAQPYVVRLN
jgi:rare lipoprotein A